jgi:hypothetical protein
MGDNTQRRKRRAAVWQDHELWYVVDRIREEFPHLTREAIMEVVERAKEDVPRSQGGGELARHVSKQLR